MGEAAGTTTRRAGASRRRPLSVCLTLVLLALLPTAFALAARPKGGASFSGKTEQRFEGFRGKVSFKVADDGGSVLRLKASFLPPCGFGGPGTGSPFEAVRFGRADVAPNGRFRKTAKRRLESGDGTTTATIRGRFTTPTRARGRARIKQTFDNGQECGPIKTKWSARVR